MGLKVSAVFAAMMAALSFATAGAAAAQRMIGGDRPVRFAAVRSPGDGWVAWLQRTGGGIQPIYYSMMVLHRDDPAAAPCVAATAVGPYLERRMSLGWEGPNRLVVRHSLNGDAAGRFDGIRHGCGDVYLRIVDTAR